jgi:hypothetical protein
MQATVDHRYIVTRNIDHCVICLFGWFGVCLTFGGKMSYEAESIIGELLNTH